MSDDFTCSETCLRNRFSTSVFGARPAVTPISFAPFDAKTRRTEAIVEQDGHRQRVMKGAVRTLAEACAMPAAEIDALERSTRR